MPWDLDSDRRRSLYCCPPYVKGGEPGEWYSGTANAIYQNLYFVDRYDPEYLLVLSGDHIYKMDYIRMIDYHVSHQADATVAVLRVPLSETHRFGILNTDPDLRIVEFDEKPTKPKNDLASTGIYVFNWKKVREYLRADAKDENSSHDFGKNVLPAMLKGGARMFAYPYDGYWKDVGTTESLWEANMELLEEEPKIVLRDQNWKIYSRSMNKPPHYVGNHADIKTSLVSEGCAIYGNVDHSVLFPGVVVEEGAYVKDSVVMADTVIGHDSSVFRSIIDENVKIGKHCVVGGSRRITLVGGNVDVKDGARVADGEWVEPKATLCLKGGEQHAD